MRKQVLVKVVAVVGVACVLGIGWAAATSRVQQELQPSLEIPLYEGAQVEWEVRLSAQEMPQGLMAWGEALGSLKIAGYQLEGERVLETVDFYDQALSDWRRIVWAKPTESGAMRLFAKGQSYLFVGISRGYETTEIVLATAQTDKTPLDAPVVEGSQLQWEVVLTSQDFLEYLKRWIVDGMKNPPDFFGHRQQWLEPAVWLGWLGGDMAFRLLEDLSELRAVGYKLEGNKALNALSFYEQQFGDWRRNLWIKPEEFGSIRIFTKSDAQGLQELSVVATMSFGFWEETSTTVIVLRARR